MHPSVAPWKDGLCHSAIKFPTSQEDKRENYPSPSQQFASSNEEQLLLGNSKCFPLAGFLLAAHSSPWGWQPLALPELRASFGEGNDIQVSAIIGSKSFVPFSTHRWILVGFTTWSLGCLGRARLLICATESHPVMQRSVRCPGLPA